MRHATIERQLNKIEHAYRFARAVSMANPREFIQAEKQGREQMHWTEVPI